MWAATIGPVRIAHCDPRENQLWQYRIFKTPLKCPTFGFIFSKGIFLKTLCIFWSTERLKKLAHKNNYTVILDFRFLFCKVVLWHANKPKLVRKLRSCQALEIDAAYAAVIGVLVACCTILQSSHGSSPICRNQVHYQLMNRVYIVKLRLCIKTPLLSCTFSQQLSCRNWLKICQILFLLV